MEDCERYLFGGVESVRLLGKADNCYFFVTLSNNFLGARRPAINYSRKLVQAYASVGMYQKKISNVTNFSS